MLSDSDREDVLGFLRRVGTGTVALKFCERFDEKSRIWNLKEHAHPYLELIYFLEGRASVAMGGNHLELAPFDLVVYPPGVVHRETLDLSSRQEIVCLWLELGGGASLPFSFKLSDDDGELGWLCRRVHQNRLWKGARYQEIEDHLLRALLLFVEQRLSHSGASRNVALDRCRAYIDEHCAETLGVEKLAEVACVTSSYLTRLFKRYLGTTPMRYRNAVRIEKAKHLLLVRSASVEEIADVLGFEDSKYFSQLFKSLTSLTPSQYRRKYRSL